MSAYWPKPTSSGPRERVQESLAILDPTLVRFAAALELARRNADVKDQLGATATFSEQADCFEKFFTGITALRDSAMAMASAAATLRVETAALLFSTPDTSLQELLIAQRATLAAYESRADTPADQIYAAGLSVIATQDRIIAQLRQRP